MPPCMPRCVVQIGGRGRGRRREGGWRELKLTLALARARAFSQGDGMPEDRLKAHELFQAWEEQCATQSAAETCDWAGSCVSPPDAVAPSQHPGTRETPAQSIREGAALRSQVDSVRQRIAKLSLQLQSPTPAKTGPPR